MSDQNLFAQQAANRRKSAWLVAGFLLFFAWIGFGGDLAFYLSTRDRPPEEYRHLIPWIGLVAVGFAGILARTSWTHGARRVLTATGAWELLEPATPEQKRLRNVVEEMAIAAGLPKPKVYVVPDPDPNAFATGRDPQHASIAVTDGLLEMLNREQLQGVVAHEMSHVRNLDIRVLTVIAALVGAVALLSDWARRGMRWSGGSRRGRDRKGSAGGVVFFAVWLVAITLAPIIGQLLAMMVSRSCSACRRGRSSGTGCGSSGASLGSAMTSVPPLQSMSQMS